MFNMPKKKVTANLSDWTQVTEIFVNIIKKYNFANYIQNSNRVGHGQEGGGKFEFFRSGDWEGRGKDSSESDRQPL